MAFLQEGNLFPFPKLYFKTMGSVMRKIAFGLYSMLSVANLGMLPGEFGHAAVRFDSHRSLPNSPVQESHMAWVA